MLRSSPCCGRCLPRNASLFRLSYELGHTVAALICLVWLLRLAAAIAFFTGGTMSEFAIMTKGLSKAFGIGVLLLAREAGMDIDLRADLDTLIQQDFRISNDLYQTLLGRR